MMRANGFTIVELMIVMMIASILSVVAAPSMVSFLKNNRIKGEAFDLVNDIQFARSEAVKRKVRVILCRSADPTATPPSCGGTANTWTTGYLVFADSNTNGTFEADELLRIGLGTSSDVIANDAADNNLEFDTDGTTIESGGTEVFALCDDRGGAYGRQINVPELGRLQLKKEGAGGAVIVCASPA